MKKNRDEKRKTISSLLKLSAIIAVMFISASNLSAQPVTGSKTIPTDYLTLAAAVTDLNTFGVGAGGATINVPAGWTEVAPGGGYVLGTATLNASLSAANPLAIQKSGAGTNPLLTAFTPGTTTNSDGIFKINGADFVTIDGINLQENAANITATMQMEWGYALVRLSGADGSQDNTITNCTITLNKANFGTPGTGGSHGIFSGSVTTANAAVTVTATTGANSRNHFYTNNISNCNIGIYCAGFNAASPYTLFDQDNYMGLGVGTGNQITNFGSSATATAVYGIYLVFQNNSNANYNTVDNASGGSGVITSGNSIGIFHDVTINTNYTANNNTVTVTSARTAGVAGSTQAIASACNPATSTTGSITINNNVVRAVIINTLTNAGNTILLISTGANAVNSVVNINNNNLTNTIGNNTAANFNLIDANDLSTNKTISGNFTSGTVGKTVSSTLSMRGISATNAGVLTGTHTFNGNNISNITTVQATPAALLGISAQSGLSLNNGPDIIATNNTVSNCTNTGTGNAQPFAVVNGKNNIVSGNTVSNIVSTGGVGFGALCGGNTTATTNSCQIFGNTVSGISGTQAEALRATGATTANVYKNKVFDITGTGGAGVGAATGINVPNSVITTSTTNIYNNLVGRIFSPLTTFSNGVVGIQHNFTSASATNLVNVYYNTVYIDGTLTGTGYTNCYFAFSANGILTLRNNIFINNSTVTVSGFSFGFRYNAAAITNYSLSSNNNIMWSGGASPFYVFGTSTTVYPFAAFQAFVAPRESLTKNESSPFLNTTNGSLATYLHINPAIATFAESGAANIATFTDDFDGVIRQGNGGYTGASLCAPDIGADEGDFTGSSFCFDASVTNIYTLGNIPVGYGSPHIIKARVLNVGASTMTSINVTLNVSGANTFSDVQSIASLSPGGSTIVSFAGFSPANTGSNTINVTISGGSDQNAANNSLTIPQIVSQNLFSYKQPGAVASGSVGVGQDGNFVAKFTTANSFGNSDTINELKVDFSALGAGNPYEYRIWDATGAGGTPGTMLFSSTQQTVVAGQAFLPVNPPVAVSGDFFVGIHEIAGNVGFQFQAESPLRAGVFYYNLTSNPTNWIDLVVSGAPTSRFWIEAQLQTPVPPNCAINMQPPASATGVCTNDILTWASGGGSPTGYRITFGTNSPNYNNIENNTDLGLVTTYTPSGGLLSNTTYGWSIVPYNLVGPATGCGIQTFTTGAVTALNEDFTNVTFPPGCWKRQTADWARNAVSANGVGTGSAWFDFYNVFNGIISDLTTPVFTAAPFNYAVTFNHAYAAYDDGASGDYIDTLEILASTNGGSSYTSVAILEGGLTGDLNTAPATSAEFVPTAAQWGTKTIPVPTGTNRIIFRAKSQFGNDLFLDNITLVVLPNCIQNPTSPANASSICPAPSTLLSWPAFPTATGYDVYFDTSNPPTTLVSTNQPGLTFTTGALTPGTYYWAVVPQLPVGTETSCDPWSFTVFEPPIPFVASNSPVCELLALTLFGDNTATGQSTGNSWSWSGPNTFSSALQNPTISSVTTAADGTYTLTVTNSNGCTASTDQVVVINTNPVLSIASQTNVTCNGDDDGTVDLDASNGTPNYLFDLDGSSSTDGIYTGLAAGTYPASVIDDNGCEGNPLSVIITEPDVLTIGSGSNSPVCTGTSLNLTSAPTGGTAGFSYSWTGPNSFTSGVQNPTISSVTAAAAGQYDVEVTDDHGCTATSSTTVSVTTGPTANITGNQSICSPQNATVNLSFTGVGPWSYVVSDGFQNVPGSTPTSPVSVSIPSPSAGTHVYTVTSVSDANCGTGGTSTGSATVNVSTAPPTNNAGPVTPSSPEACSGTVLLINTTTITGQNIRYSWNTGSNSGTVLYSTNIGGPFSPPPFETTSPTVYAQFGTLAGSSGYSVCVQGVNGCGSGSNKCTWIRGVVSVPGTINPANPVACPNDVKSYSCGISSGATVYNWTLAGSAVPITSGQGTTNVSVTFPPAFTSGQLCVSAALACGGSSTSAPRCMSISKNPAVPGAFTAGPSSVCPGATGVTFTVPIVTGATGYSWTVPAGCTITSGANTNSIQVSFPNPYLGAPPVCVSATSACGSSVSRCKTVGSSLPVQPGSMSGPTTNICSSTVQYSVPNVPGATSYTWTNPSGTTISNGQGTTTILLSVGPAFGSGFLTVTANTTACTPGTSLPRTITITGKPNTPGTITANPTVFCNGGFVNFSVTSVIPLPNYNWTVSQGTITAGQLSNNIDVTWGTGTGTVNVSASNGCGISALRSQSFTSGCREEEFSASDNISVYPNPAHDKVIVSIYVKEFTQFNFKLRDISGRVIISEDHDGVAGLNAFDLELKNFTKGIYMLEVQSPGKNWKTKLVVD